MIIWHQTKFAKQAGNHVRVDMLRTFVINQIAATSAAPANEEIEQARSTMRFVFSRIFGRVN